MNGNASRGPKNLAAHIVINADNAEAPPVEVRDGLRADQAATARYQKDLQSVQSPFIVTARGVLASLKNAA
jgi:hypothetical protein